MGMHRNCVIVGPASTEGVYYALCRACGDHSPVVTDPEEALEMLDHGAGAHACRLQTPLFAPEAEPGAVSKEERVWHGAA